MSDQPDLLPRIGISACLLGQEVRFDGGHRRDRYLTEVLAPYCEWVPVCPEVELGLGTPRETIQLVQFEDRVRLRSTKTGVDLTARMQRFAKSRAAELAQENLCGFVFKKSSPSCGMERVKVHQAKGPAKRTGRGLFGGALIDRMLNLPVEEEGRLCDPRLRENWLERVFAYQALQRMWQSRWKVDDLVQFHRRYQFVLLAHDQQGDRELGRLVAEAKSVPPRELQERYETLFMTSLKKIATPRKNTNVLQRMIGFFKKDLDAATRQELVRCIEDYHAGIVPLIVPVTLIRHYVRLLGVPYLQDQVYLNPHPDERALRNRV